jgi:3-oxoacyl-[acyl-carrier protein] reductase
MSNNQIKTAIVTGSTQGIGLAIAMGLIGENFRVGINGRSSAKVEEICSRSEHFFNASSDVNDENKLTKVKNSVAEKYGFIDLLVCNVGGGKPNPNLPLEEEWERVFKLNLFSAMNTSSNFGELLAPGSGKIIFISSIAGNSKVKAPPAYGAAKLALNSYSKLLAKELAPKGICVNTLLLGNIMFKGSTWEEKMTTHADETIEYLRQSVPLNSFGSTEEVVKWCIFLSQNEIRFTTGAVIPIDGGQIL